MALHIHKLKNCAHTLVRDVNWDVNVVFLAERTVGPTFGGLSTSCGLFDPRLLVPEIAGNSNAVSTTVDDVITDPSRTLFEFEVRRCFVPQFVDTSSDTFSTTFTSLVVATGAWLCS